MFSELWDVLELSPIGGAVAVPEFHLGATPAMHMKVFAVPEGQATAQQPNLVHIATLGQELLVDSDASKAFPSPVVMLNRVGVPTHLVVAGVMGLGVEKSYWLRLQPPESHMHYKIECVSVRSPGVPRAMHVLEKPRCEAHCGNKTLVKIFSSQLANMHHPNLRRDPDFEASSAHGFVSIDMAAWTDPARDRAVGPPPEAHPAACALFAAYRCLAWEGERARRDQARGEHRLFQKARALRDALKDRAWGALFDRGGGPRPDQQAK